MLIPDALLINKTEKYFLSYF